MTDTPLRCHACGKSSPLLWRGGYCTDCRDQLDQLPAPVSRRFPLGAVLTITTGRMLCHSIETVFDILNYLTGEILFTHQMPRALRACTPHILAGHPRLADIVVPEHLSGEHDYRAWIGWQTETYGGTLELEPLPAGAWEHINPIAELASTTSKPIVVVAPESGRQ